MCTKVSPGLSLSLLEQAWFFFWLPAGLSLFTVCCAYTVEVSTVRLYCLLRVFFWLHELAMVGRGLYSVHQRVSPDHLSLIACKPSFSQSNECMNTHSLQRKIRKLVMVARRVSPTAPFFLFSFFCEVRCVTMAESRKSCRLSMNEQKKSFLASQK